MTIPGSPALTSAANKLLVQTLLSSRMFRDYEKVFTEATGLPLTLQPLEFWQLAHYGKKNENAFCALLAERPATLAVCLKTHDDMTRHTKGIPHSVTCPFGLTETAIPVESGEQIIAYLRIGQVLRHAPLQSDTMKVTRELARQGVAFDEQLRAAWNLNPLIPPVKYSATIRLLSFFGEQLSALANQIMLERQNAEPPLVQKARDYIEKHKIEPLTLGAVAQAAGASLSHFCKVFHKATGLKFTDYVARVRIEDARTQLLNPNRRISEVAYDVGCQSLTHFNRVFKRVFGQSPTDFRAHLHGSVTKATTRRPRNKLKTTGIAKGRRIQMNPAVLISPR
jgi:AraC-like DNA-binding protein/ligand-binding sensor protein